MKPLHTIDMFEVTRLTRAGRLHEAMAMLRGEAQPDASPDAKTAGPEDHRLAIDLSPPVGGENSWRFAERATAAPGSIGMEEMRLPEGMRKWMGRLLPAHLNSPDLGRSGIAIPDGARFEDRIFVNEAGSRAYKLYVPSVLRDEALPLIVMLHGCTQSPDDFATGTRMNEVAEEFGFFVAYPEQSKSANASKCWNWFNGTDQRRGRGEPSLIAGIAREVMHDFPVREGQVYVAGMSAGGAAAAIMGEAYPDLFAAVGVHSGLACGLASDVATAFGAMRDGGSTSGSSRRGAGRIPPTIVFHGDKDGTVNPVNADQVIARAKADAKLTSIANHGTARGGMRFTRTVTMNEVGDPVLEQWTLHGAGHAWSGGNSAGSYTDPSGPDASREMARFFLQQARRG
ncbi:alpha/beta hydrolase family esterase [Aquabacter cavernae]|uniref:extracellular catalytic domain type 1 short-chain-length polyhydroxyalkanoate depolymerase n=1 Tax=Aquabacter cavernae TaxID=2496029 RepID=UPI000F8CE5FD|nr:PHB depolymerase family esterase [Aquabacter cavernae]